jgi:hypothetical protein
VVPRVFALYQPERCQQAYREQHDFEQELRPRIIPGTSQGPNAGERKSERFALA